MIGKELEVTFQYVYILQLLIIILIVDFLFLAIYINCKQRTSFRAVSFKVALDFLSLSKQDILLSIMVYILAVSCLTSKFTISQAVFGMCFL